MLEEIIAWWYEYVIPKGYTPVEMILFFIGLLCWIYAYVIILRNVKKYQINEMPFLIAPGNFAWEIIWSFFFWGDLGQPFRWGVRVWFLLDCFINYFSIKNATKLILNKNINPYIWIIYFFSLGGWFAIVWSMGENGDDNRLGVVSALAINVVMSSLYIDQLLKFPQYRNKGFSYNVAVLKMVGTGVITISSTMHWEDNSFLISLGLLSFILDITYVYLFKNYNPQES